MKRKADCDLEYLFENLNISKKRSSTQLVVYESLVDPFGIGQIPDGVIFTRSEVIKMINLRENTLRSKFSYFLTMARKNSWLRNVRADTIEKVLKWVR